MDFKQYFQNELIELRRRGQAAAKRNPALLPFFDTPGRDAGVERLLESFAFLSGRFREKLDDDLPEITHGLFGLLWPNYLRPFPATSIVQYRPAENLAGSAIIPRGTQVRSVPVDGTPCTFQTVFDTEVLPLRIAEQWFIERNGMTILAVRFALTSGQLQSLPLSRLRFFFTGNETAAHTLYLTLLRYVQEVRFVLRDDQKEEYVTATLPHTSLAPVGFQKGEGLCPYPEHTGMGYRILQEYFAFPEKFLFVEICGLEDGLQREVPEALRNAVEFELHFVLKRRPEAYTSLNADNWQLFCTPVVNLFPFQASPLSVPEAQKDYRITPAPHSPEHFKIYSVDRVSRWQESEKEKFAYTNALSFVQSGMQNSSSLTYRLNIKPFLDGEETETYISISHVEPDGILMKLKLTCTNGLLPCKLQIGDIHIPNQSDGTSAIPFTNILPVTTHFPPPIRDGILWKLLSNMSLNYITLVDVCALRAVLSSYHFRAMRDQRCARKLDKIMRSILSIKTVETDRLFCGVPVRGAQTQLTLDADCFSCEGALFLFGSVLNEFFALYATRNSFQRLIVATSRGEEYQWPARLDGGTGN